MANRCDNCGKNWTDEQIVTPIPHLEERLDSGGIVPSGECPECGSLVYPITTPEEIGNQFGYLCPQCKKGDKLRVSFTGECVLTPDGTEDDGDHEWDNDSPVFCNCLWCGQVKDLEEAENFEEGD